MAKPLLKKGTTQRGFNPAPKRPTIELDEDEDSLLTKVEGELSEQGIHLFDNENVVDEYLRLPADITEITSQELGRYFNAFTQQKLWTRTLLGRTSAVLREEEDKLDEIRDRVYSQLPAKMSIKEKELKIRSDELDGMEATEFLKQIAIMQEKRKMLFDYLDSLVDGIMCISREITRRQDDYNDLKRGDNMDKRRK